MQNIVIAKEGDEHQERCFFFLQNQSIWIAKQESCTFGWIPRVVHGPPGPPSSYAPDFQIWTMFLYLVTGYYHCLSGHTPVSACTTSVNLSSLAVDDSLLHHLASRMVKTRYSESYCQWTFHVYNFSRCFYVRKCFSYFHYCSLSYFFTCTPMQGSHALILWESSKVKVRACMAPGSSCGQAGRSCWRLT